MAHHSELMLPCLDAVGARSVVEVGAYAGDLTRRARGLGGADRARGSWRSTRRLRTSSSRWRPTHDGWSWSARPASRRCPSIDAARRRDHRRRPQLLHGARGAAADRRAARAGPSCRCCCSTTSAGRTAAATTTSIPSRSPPSTASRWSATALASSRRIPGVRPDGLPYPRSAAREGGPRNGVLTAVEDFVAQRRGAAAGGRPGVLRLRRRLAPRRAMGAGRGRGPRPLGP